jgi:predicted porin
MKKHLIAAAVAAAVVAPAAMAQSSVEVYGVLDASIARIDPGSASSYTTTVSSVISSSRLGFRGTEDLGGGLKARFVLETGVDTRNGNMGSPGGTANFNRDAFVALDGAFGSIAIGKIDTSQAEGVDTFTTQIGNAGFAGSGVELGGDQNGTVRYTTPTFGGFSAQVGYTTLADATNDLDITSFSASYVNGPLGLIAGQDRRENATGSDTTYTAFGARYNFGVASVGLFTGEQKTGSAKYYVTIASARVPLANGLALHAAYRMGDEKGVGDADSPIFAVTKALSKRTSLYAAYSTTSVDLDGAAPLAATRFFNAGSTAADDDGSVLALGVIHTF